MKCYLFPLQVEGGKLKMEFGTKYAVSLISQQSNQRLLKTTKFWKNSVLLKQISPAWVLLY